MKKQEWDKYYTNRDIALECIQTIDDDYDLWLEPSAGNGSFLHQIQGTKLGILTYIVPGSAVGCCSLNFSILSNELTFEVFLRGVKAH